MCAERTGSQCTHVRCDEYARMTIRVTSTGMRRCVHTYICARMHVHLSSVEAFRKHWQSMYIAQIGRGSTAIRGYIPFIITVWSTAGKREGTRALSPALRREQRARAAALFVTLWICKCRLCTCHLYASLPVGVFNPFIFVIYNQFWKKVHVSKNARSIIRQIVSFARQVTPESNATSAKILLSEKK